MKKLLCTALMLLHFSVFVEENFPLGCNSIAVKDPTIILKPGKLPVLVLIHNTSNLELWVTHPVAEPNANAGWSSKLQGGNWSALSVQNDAFELSCIESQPGHEQQVPCTGLLSMCLWEGLKAPESNSGTYWVGENSTLPALKANLSERGFVLPTPSHQ